MSQQKITLEAWATARYKPAPSLYTLRKWARNCQIFPAPQKIGRTWYVDADARYIERDKYA